MVTERLAIRESRAEAWDDCLRRSLDCQLACIACAESGLRSGPLEPNSPIVVSCLHCLDACMALAHAVMVQRSRPERLAPFVVFCIDACVTFEAKCRELALVDAAVQRCRAACLELRESCRALLTSVTPDSQLSQS